MSVLLTCRLYLFNTDLLFHIIKILMK